MNKRFLSVLIFALIVAGGATLIFYRLVSSRLSAVPNPVPTTEITVAARDLPVGTLIRETDLSTAQWSGSVPQLAVTKKEDLVGRGVVSPIYQGEPILETRLAPKGAGAGLAATIPPGMRAVAIRVNEIIGVAGFVVPGMRVDVLIAGKPPDSPASLGTLSRTLLQNIEVLSAGQNIQKDAEGKPISVPVVNLLVTPEQAEALSLASNETKIQLVLRNPLDTTVAKTPGTALSRLFTGTAAPEPRPAAAAKPRPVVQQAAAPVKPKETPAVVVEVIQGGKKASATFKGEPEE
ncbi:MAG TPA: Flp pilus assembly protein CpaB [Bryobacteraceae bacterium]|nr:Flp pilus assembly protein CpaB [Bryobacteraceae bacterium]